MQRLWNPFSKKSTASSTKGLTRDEVDGNAQFAEHYASWQERRGVYGDTMYVFEHRVRKPFQRELDRAAEHAEAALATITRSDEDLDELIAVAEVEQALATGELRRTTLDALKPFGVRGGGAIAFFQAATAYAQAFDRAMQLAHEFQTYADQGSVNCRESEEQAARSMIASGVLHRDLLTFKDSNGVTGGEGWSEYLAEDETQKFYGQHRKR